MRVIKHVSCRHYRPMITMLSVYIIYSMRDVTAMSITECVCHETGPRKFVLAT